MVTRKVAWCQRGPTICLRSSNIRWGWGMEFGRESTEPCSAVSAREGSLLRGLQESRTRECVGGRWWALEGGPRRVDPDARGVRVSGVVRL